MERADKGSMLVVSPAGQASVKTRKSNKRGRAMEANNVVTVFGSGDYIPLEALSLTLDNRSIGESESFTLCFWIYLLKSTRPGRIIHQGRPEGAATVPLLALNSDRKLVLHPLRLEDGKSCECLDDELVVSDQVCPMEKWIHVGCEIGATILRLHMVGTIVGERNVSGREVIESIRNSRGTIFLSGRRWQASGTSIEGYIYYLRLLPQPTITNHYVKNPPLELLLDGPSGSSEDYELEEGGDGVWSVVGGKASCRRNFALDVTLLDALGRSVHKDMELVAFLVFADTGMTVEKPKDDAEAPLLVTFDGVEFPSSERPIKLVHARASFKLKISQLSSKCDNRLFRVCFDSPNTPKFPFLRALSRPIRCVSRNRNHRMPLAHRRLNPAGFQVDGSISSGTEDPSTADADGYCTRDNYCNDDMADRKDVCKSSEQNSLKRTRSRLQKESPVTSNGHGFLLCPPDNRQGISVNKDSGCGLSPGFQVQQPALPAASVVSGVTWPGPSTGMSARMSVPEPKGIADIGNCREGFAERSNLSIPTTVRDDVNVAQRWNGALFDQLVFEYCLESMHGRGEFLKAFVMSRGDHELSEFATRVSQFTGCRHDAYQILISRSLVASGSEVWSQVLQESYPPLWMNVARHIETSFATTCGCVKRSLSPKDTQFLKRIAGCGDIVSPEEFGRLWNWIYPVALALRSSQLRSTWDNEDPRWIEGMITRDEVEEMLHSREGRAKPGTFLLRFACSRRWPHPDSGALVVSYIGHDMRVHHKLLSMDDSSGFTTGERTLPEQLLSQPELTQLWRNNAG